MPQDKALNRSLKALSALDEDMARAIRLVGPLPDRMRSPGFAALLKILCEQQLSVASAAAIWKRLEEKHAPLTPESILAADETDLRALGLSRAKILYSRHLCQALLDRAIDLDRLQEMSDADAVMHLSQVKGIGRWTAEVYLLFAMGRPDIWPADDLALQEGMRLLKRFRARPDRQRMDKIAKPWTPHRGTAARVVWRYYGLAKKGALPPDGA